MDTDSVDDDFCYLTTTGRVSGRPHTIEIWFATRDRRRLYLLAGGGERSDWVRNLMANPAARVRVGEAEFDAAGAVITDAVERRGAAQLVFDKYQPRYTGDLASWRETALPVAIDIVT